MFQPQYEDKDTAYAYRVIHDFFDAFGFTTAIAFLERILQTASAGYSWKKGDPYDVVYFMQKLSQLAEVAYVIHTPYAIRKDAVISPSEKNTPPDLSITENYFTGHIHGDAWSSLPRNLTAKQYHDPYKAIHKFCKYTTSDEWDRIFSELAEYALSRYTPEEMLYPYNLLTVRKRLLQLIEACHLVRVRTHPRLQESKTQSNNDH